MLEKGSGQPMELTMAEKRDLLDRIRKLVLADVIKKKDRDEIYRVCMAACSRELAKLQEKEE